MTKTEKDKNNKGGRREFLTKVWRWLGLIAFAELAFFTFSMIRPGKKENNNDSNLKVAGTIEDFPLNSVTADRVNKYFLVRTSDGGFLALSIICSHLGCSVMWDENENQFLCPCHSSAFDKKGNVINSPAPRALDYFPVIIEAGLVKIDLAHKMKRKEFENKQVTYAI